MNTKCVLFDLDGTLIRAVHIHRQAFCDSYREVTGKQISAEYHDQELNGLPTKTKLRKLLISDDLTLKISNLKQRKTIQLIEEQIFFDVEKVKLLCELETLNIKIGCVTNSIRVTAELMLSRAGLLEKLRSCLITNEDVIHPKPSPEGYLRAMQTLCVSPLETLIVEDAPTGRDAARASGAKLWHVRDERDVTWEEIQTRL